VEAATPAGEFRFESRYVELKDALMHYVEAGEGVPIVFIHGGATWSYLWRNLLPVVSERGRAIAIDLIGMGRSSRPAVEYRFVDHAGYLDRFIETLGVRRSVLVGHDWGASLAMHYARRHPENVTGLVFLETILGPIPGWGAVPRELRQSYQALRHPDQGRKAAIDENVVIESLLPAGVLRRLTDQELQHYREPYREAAHREPLWRWPNELPIAGQPADVHEILVANRTWLTQTPLPKLLLYANPGQLIDSRVVDWCRQSLRNLTTVDVGRGLHYLPEDQPERSARAIASWLRGIL